MVSQAAALADEECLLPQAQVFLAAPRDLLGLHLPAAPGGLAGQEGTAHKSRRAQAKTSPAKASGNSPPPIRDIVPPGSSGGNSMALFRDSRAYHLRQSWLLVIARVWSTPRVVRTTLIAQVLPDNRTLGSYACLGRAGLIEKTFELRRVISAGNSASSTFAANPASVKTRASLTDRAASPPRILSYRENEDRVFFCELRELSPRH